MMGRLFASQKTTNNVANSMVISNSLSLGLDWPPTERVTRTLAASAHIN